MSWPSIQHTSQMSMQTSLAEASNRDDDIDDALITDSVKKLLSDSGTNFDGLAADLLSPSGSANAMPMSSAMHSHAATMQEGIDLVDALDTLVQRFNQQSNNNNNNNVLESGNGEHINYNNNNNNAIDSLLMPSDVVFMDHNYCKPFNYRSTPAHPLTNAPLNVTPLTVPISSSSLPLSVPLSVSASSIVSTVSQTHSIVSSIAEPQHTFASTTVVNQLSSIADITAIQTQLSVDVTNNASSVSSNSSPNSYSSFNSSSNNTNTTSGKQTPKTPTASRRSQRQIDKIEKSVLEKIKAENAEMLKREKESMTPQETPNKVKLDAAVNDDTKDADESELVIDFDNNNKSSGRKDKQPKSAQGVSGKKRLRKSSLKSQTDALSKKSRIEMHNDLNSSNAAKHPEDIADAKQHTQQLLDNNVKQCESSELDDVIAALSAVDNNIANEDSDTKDGKTPSSGRSQRTRRKPKRWDDDEVEVDFSGQLGILATQEQQQLQQQPPPPQPLPLPTPPPQQLQPQPQQEEQQQISDEALNESHVNNKSAKSQESSSSDEAMDDEDESGSEFGSEDDPDKLWCICRQPHDDRFMIGCDSCEEWFHGNCVNVTKQQGRQMEKAGQEWLCPSCKKGISEGLSRENLKKTADEKRTKLESEERIRAQVKKAARDQFLKKEKSRETAKQRRDSTSSLNDKTKKKEPSVSPEKQLRSLPKKLHLPLKKREANNIKLEEEKDKEKLKKLIKTSKKEFKKKRELMGKKRDREEKNSKPPLMLDLDPISRVVPVVRKPEVKKKHKDAIDPSVQDLFKAEPIKKTPQTPTTPVTPGTPGGTPFRNKTTDSRRISTTLERQCPASCGKMVKSDTTIYCSQECIEIHVNETIKLLRIARKEKGDVGNKVKDSERRVIVVEKASGRLLSGKDGVLEKDVLEFIKTNPTFEVFRPSNIKDRKKDDIKSKPPLYTSPVSATKNAVSPKKDKKSPVQRQSSKSGEFCYEGQDPIRANVKTSLKETLISRCRDVNDMVIQTDEIRKIAIKIEEELFKLFNKDTSGKYRNKYRSLIFNLKDLKNQGLFRKVVNGKISPERLVQMSAEELASSELAKWREREKITMLEMIKRDAADKVNQVIVKKTHKGEELIETTLVSETTNEPKLAEGKQLTPTSTPNSSVSTLLDDLMGTSAVDTTSQHRTHLFSNNCKICTKQQIPDDIKQTESVKKLSSNSLSIASREDTASSRPAPKRVRVELDTTNKFLQEAAKLTSIKLPVSADDDDSAEAPSSTLCLSSPEAPSSSSSSRPIWKGSVFMQDVAKFSANAIKVSGSVSEFLSQDVAEQITVCGRIAPEQVLDYVKKLKYSSRTEIGIIKFVSSREERVGYDAFFNYLDSRGRYGVVGSTGKLLKDFYILPLPRNGDVPDVLLPFDGPGLDKKSLRPNLLLGILVRSKKPIASQTSQSSSSSTSSALKTKTSNAHTNADRSYTPPPKNSSTQSSPEDKDSGDVSYTPPRIASTNKSKSKLTTDDDEPYDPEEADLSNSNSLPSSTSSIQELMEQIAKSSNPVEMTSSVLSAIANSSNYELQRRLLDQLTAKVEEQKRQLEEQKQQAEAQYASTSTSLSSQQAIPGLDGQFGSLRDIKIPDNLQDILSSVRQKTNEIERQQERLKAVAASGFRFEDPIVKNFSKNTVESDKIEPPEASPETEPMELDEDVTPTKSTIIEVNPPSNSGETSSAQPSVTDPRLRSKKQTPLPSLAQETGGAPEVAAMTADELMQKAREQMAALAQMEKSRSDEKPSAASAAAAAAKRDAIKIEWKKKK